MRPFEYEYRFTEYEYRFTEYEYRFTEYEYRFTEYEYRFTEYEEIGSEVRCSCYWVEKGTSCSAGAQKKRTRRCSEIAGCR